MKVNVVYNYDVWGNKKIGYEINERRTILEDAYICSSDFDDDDALLDWLKAKGLLNDNVRRNQITIDCYWYIIERRTGMPLYTIYSIE